MTKQNHCARVSSCPHIIYRDKLAVGLLTAVLPSHHFLSEFPISCEQDYIFGGGQGDMLYGEAGKDYIYGKSRSIIAFNSPFFLYCFFFLSLTHTYIHLCSPYRAHPLQVALESTGFGGALAVTTFMEARKAITFMDKQVNTTRFAHYSAILDPQAFFLSFRAKGLLVHHRK